MGHKNWPAELGLVVLIVVATVFAFTPLVSAQTYTDLDNFAGSSAGDGAKPADGFIQVGSVLYGTTVMGGASEGTLFSLNTQNNQESVVYNFGTTVSNDDGILPRGALLQVGSVFYGTTSANEIGNGSLFSYDLSTNTESPVF